MNCSDSESEEGRSPVRRGFEIALAIVLLPLGVVGLFVPVLQGVLFLLIAVALLSNEVPWLGRQQDKLRERYPEAFRRGDELKARARRSFRHWFGGRDADVSGGGGSCP